MENRSDHYLSTVDSPAKNDFVARYQKLYPGELPNMDSFGGWTAVYMPYCSSDVWYGDSDADPEAGIPWAFKGHRIVNAEIEDLKERGTRRVHSIATAQRVLQKRA